VLGAANNSPPEAHGAVASGHRRRQAEPTKATVFNVSNPDTKKTEGDHRLRTRSMPARSADRHSGTIWGLGAKVINICMQAPVAA
jgi:hypothetical protein